MKSIALLLAPLMMASLSFANGKYETAVFAGGCFWCVQPVFDHISGVIKSEAGYANGKEPSPTYEDYTEKGYVEAVRVTYDPQKTTYAILLSEFWKQIDPTDSKYVSEQIMLDRRRGFIGHATTQPPSPPCSGLHRRVPSFRPSSL